MYKVDANGFATRLREARKKKKLRQSDLLPLIGVSHATYSDWENGNKVPGLDQIYSLSNALDASPQTLIFGNSLSVTIDGAVLYHVLSETSELLNSITDDKIKAELISAKYNEAVLKIKG